MRYRAAFWLVLSHSGVARCWSHSGIASCSAELLYYSAVIVARPKPALRPLGSPLSILDKVLLHSPTMRIFAWRSWYSKGVLFCLPRCINRFGVTLFRSPVGISASSRIGLTASSILRHPVRDSSLNTSLKAFCVCGVSGGTRTQDTWV